MKKISAFLFFIIVIASCKKNNENPSSPFVFEANINGVNWKADSVFAVRLPANAPPLYAHFEIEAKKNDGSYIFLQSYNDSISAITFKQMLISFTGKIDIPDSNYVTVNWQTASENNTKSFQVQRSYDGTNFDSAKEIAAYGNGNHSYSFSEKPYLTNAFSTALYYRLKIIDTDGSFLYSTILFIRFGAPALYIFSSQDYAFGYDGSINITSADKTKKLISGNFKFSFTDDSNHQHIKVTNGKFENIPYH